MGLPNISEIRVSLKEMKLVFVPLRLSISDAASGELSLTVILELFVMGRSV